MAYFFTSSAANLDKETVEEMRSVKKVIEHTPHLGLGDVRIFRAEVIISKSGEDKKSIKVFFNSRAPAEPHFQGLDDSIEDAKENGILECVVSTSESRRTSGGTKFLTLSVTDGDNFSRIQIWSNTIDEYGEEYFQPGSGLNMRVAFNEKYKSFNLKKDYPITRLPKKDDLEELYKYIEDTEIFPEPVDIEADFLGEFE